jgi:DNA-binding CsgD family transcriptional regulator
MVSSIDWKDVNEKRSASLSDEDREIVSLLALGRSTPEIAKALGQHRSMVWRKVQRIRSSLTSGPGQ